MKFGISSYCLHPSLQSKAWDIVQALEWIKAQGADHVEITPIGIDFAEDPQLADVIAAKSRELGLDVVNYAVGGDVIKDTAEVYAEELERLKRAVDLAARLGATRMRHDVVPWAYKSPSVGQFERHFDRLVEASGAIADYAAQYGITTMVENHGFYVTPSDRALRLVQAVNRPNFKMLLDIGNFLCVDEDPVSAVKQSLPYAALVHFKDFYIRRGGEHQPGEGWLETLGGNFIRGAIFGHGDMETRRIVRLIKASGYSGPISLEYEGGEDDRTGTRIGLANARRFWDEA